MRTLFSYNGRGENMDDDRIIDLYWQRSQTAISETSMKYGAYCRTIGYNILGNFPDAEECENDTYVAAWNAIPPTRPRILKAFLGRLTRNIALDRLDYNRAKKRNSEFATILSEIDELSSFHEDVEGEYTAGETAKIISKFLRSIDIDNRLVFIRRYWYSDSIKDISTRMNMSESKVKSMLFRTRKKLKVHLERKGVVV